MADDGRRDWRGLGGVCVATGRTDPGTSCPEGSLRGLRSRGAVSRAVAWGGRPARGGAAVISKHVRLPDRREWTNSNQMTFEFA